MLTTGTAFEEHLARRTVAAQEFHAVGATDLLQMAAKARSRVISEVQVGQLTGLLFLTRTEEERCRISLPCKRCSPLKKGKAVHLW